MVMGPASTLNKIALVISALGLVALLGVLIAGALVQRALDTPMQLPGEEVIWELPPGASLGRAAAELAAAGWLDSDLPVRLYSRITGRGHLIQTGEYRLWQGITPREWLQLLERGQVIQYQLTFPEGWTVRQVWDYLQGQGSLVLPPALAFEQLAGEIIAENQYASLEGLLFPDTYNYVRGSDGLALLRQAHRRMLDILAEEWAVRAVGLPYETPYQALIMASLIEKETAVPAERGTIAGVFVRRLQQGMRLQTDPAVIYGLGQDFDGNLTRAHLRDSDNPWNTYRHAGLPPTPIGLPGREAIRAALNPEPGEALYFVARGDGSHHFSSTFEEHQQAVRKYQLQRRSDYRSTPGS